MSDALAYIPMDRRHALAHGRHLPDRTVGCALFADISGFTPLTEALVRELGPQRGAEELTRYLNLVYDAVIDELHHFGGSVIAFAGDAITCWIEGDDGRRATACGLAMQAAMRPFAAIVTPAGSTVSLGMKAAVAAGPARRFLIGDPTLRVIDALAGMTLVRLANAEHLAKRGETVIDGTTLAQIQDLVQTSEIRTDTDGQRIAVVTALQTPVTATPWPALDPAALAEDRVRVWLLPQVYERLHHGLGNFLAELRPTVACFLRFAGIDFDNDEAAGTKLDTYIRWVQSVVARYEGTLIDLNIGDKGSYLYINFGAPLAHEDNADRAAAAALVLRDGPALDYIAPVQIGISQGRMRAGAYGGANHRTYGVLGDEVNMAARLMMAAKAGQIIVSEAAQRSLSNSFVLEELPPIRVKGKSEPATIFALVGIQQGHGLPIATALYALPMIGRQGELILVREQVRKAAEGHGQIVSLIGEAGLGKSRLVAAVMADAANLGFVLYGGECESYGVNSSYLVWQSIWRGLFALEPSWPLARQIKALEHKLRQIHHTLPSRLPLLGVLLNLEIPENDVTQSLDAKLRKALLEAMLVECLRAEARQRPLLLLLEACQWIDPLSFDLLEVIGGAIAELPITLLLAYRPNDTERLRNATFSSQPYYTAMPLVPFTAAEAAALVQAKLTQLIGDATSVPAHFTQRIIDQAEGNPFYIEELINYLHDRKIDFRDSNALDQVELPDSLQRLVLSHVDQLSESQKITIKVASVIGRLFRAAWLYGVYPELGDASRIHTDLELLHQQEWVQHESGQAEIIYLFRQVITQSVTYESLPHALKAVLHEQIGAFIEARYAATLDQYLDLLAYHYDRTDNLEKRRTYLRKAGEAAQADYANTVAIDYFLRLLPHLPEGEQATILLALGQVLDTTGDYDAADSRFQAALAQAAAQHDTAMVAQCQIALGELRRKQSQYEAAATYFAEAQAVAAGNDDQAGMAKALVCTGSLALYQGNYNEAQLAYLQSLAIRRHLDDQPNIANVLNNLAITAANQGDFGQASALFSESLTIRRTLRQRWGIANSLNNLGELAQLQQQYAEARTYLEEAVVILREIGDKWSLGNALVNLGNALRAQGDYQLAYPLYQESLQINRELNDRWMLAYLLENIGLLLALLGAAPDALRLTGAASVLRERIGTPLSPAEQLQLENALTSVRQTLGPENAEAAWQAGRALALMDAIELALINRPQLNPTNTQ